MSTLRIWWLRTFAILMLATGAWFLYAAYDDLSWTRRAMTEAGERAWVPGRTQDSIIAESGQKNISGRAAEYSGCLLLAAGIITEALAAVLATHRKGASLTP